MGGPDVYNCLVVEELIHVLLREFSTLIDFDKSPASKRFSREVSDQFNLGQVQNLL